ncbi:ABC transporter permease [Phytoactinopolyspora halotolerans]|uniref:ABC transporter permease n=1 Tax=Phytoactinopolyspora halotolerans TaxID=1981512 RepID=A0A6L9S5Z9_9ACTN|nr:ABC transporter permease [Phytoactinopolyspora halotolerans]NEE00171.1 ABC transporter permease [Phytoactinopolyspora halotolerans]
MTVATRLSDPISGRAGRNSRRAGRNTTRAGLVIGMVLLLALVALAVVIPFLRPDPNLTDYAAKLAAPSWEHPLGTDQAGRDVLARLAAGARVSLGTAMAVTVLSTVAGLVVGLVPVAAGRLADSVLSRAVDVVLAIPQLVLALAVIGVLGPGVVNLMVAMALAGWAPMARYARAYALAHVDRPFVTAARMAGVGHLRVLWRHVTPATTLSVLSVATLSLAEVIIGLSGLSFLGLGVSPPTAEWGQMVADGRAYLSQAPWLVIAPTAAIVASVGCVSLLADAIKEAPR